MFLILYIENKGNKGIEGSSNTKTLISPESAKKNQQNRNRSCIKAYSDGAYLLSSCHNKPKLPLQSKLDPASTCCYWRLCLRLPLFRDMTALVAPEWNPEEL